MNLPSAGARPENEPLPLTGPMTDLRSVPVSRIAYEARRREGVRRSLNEAAQYVKADRPDVAEYLDAVRHGIHLGELALHGTKHSYGSPTS